MGKGSNGLSISNEVHSWPSGARPGAAPFAPPPRLTAKGVLQLGVAMQAPDRHSGGFKGLVLVDKELNRLSIGKVRAHSAPALAFGILTSPTLPSPQGRFCSSVCPLISI